MINNLKNRLSTDDIIKYLAHFGARVDERITNNGELRFQTVCHMKLDNKYKLYYYIKSKTFYCYNSCGSIGDIFALTQHILEIDAKEAFRYVCNFFKLSASSNIEFIYDEENWGLDDIKEEEIEYVSNKLENITYKPIPKVDENIMNIFLKYSPAEWLSEGISEDTLKKYDIRYSLKQNAIVIPHHDIDSNLVGIRVRNLNEEYIEEFGKYNPLYVEGDMYNHKLGHNLYGLAMNKDYIQKVKKVVIVESEKAVLQMDSFFGDKSIAVAICGSNLSRVQMKILLDLGVEEFILGLDKQYSNTAEENIWLKKIEKMVKPLLEVGITVTRIWDDIECGLLKHKDSPTDLGKDTYLKLVKSRIGV